VAKNYLIKTPALITVGIKRNFGLKELSKYLDEYQKGIKNISRTFTKRAGSYAQAIAPFNYGDMGGVHGRLKSDISYNYDEGEEQGTVTVDSLKPVKAIVQEFGYPKSRRNTGILAWENALSRWDAPYKPNPKRKAYYRASPAGRIRGLGYLRVGTYLAAESLLTDKPFLDGTPPSMSEVKAFQKNVVSRFLQIARKYTIAYGKGSKQGLPKYVTNKVQFPEKALISKYTSNIKMGEIKYRVPIKLAVSDEAVPRNITK
jgi:hypothetical protein